MGSSRFPGKPLAPILGRPMIEHVFRRVRMCKFVDEVVVATCDNEIRDAAMGFGCNVIMTSSSHARASDRVAEAAEKIDAGIVVMVQGDEPMVTPGMIETAVSAMQGESGAGCVNLMKKIESVDEFNDRNTIKVVFDKNSYALYFSREPVPTAHVCGFSAINAYKQVCIIPFTRETLGLYARLAPTPLENAESVDMMRLLEHGHKIKMSETLVASHAVDTPADLKKVEELMRKEALT